MSDATSQQARDAILDLIIKTAERATEAGGNTSSQSGIALALAEAHAWVLNAGQAHG
jgi:hypothetical protein